MPDWMPHFAAFTTQDRFSLWSLVVATLALAANVLTAFWANRKTDIKLKELERSMAGGLDKLEGKVNGLDWNYAYVIGVLDGAGLTRTKRTRNG